MPMEKGAHKRRKKAPCDVITPKTKNEKFLAKGLGFKRFYGGVKREWLVFAVDMHSPEKSGYLVEQAKQMWTRPLFTSKIKNAHIVKATDEEVGDILLRMRSYMNQRLYLVPIEKAEAESFVKSCQPLPYDDKEIKINLRKNGRIKFYD